MIYFVRLEDLGKVKVGYADIVPDRIKQLRKDFGEITFLFAFEGDLLDEQELHRELRHSGGRNFWRKARVERYDMSNEELESLRERFRKTDGYTEEEGVASVSYTFTMSRELSDELFLLSRRRGLKMKDLVLDAIESLVKDGRLQSVTAHKQPA